MTLSSGTRLGPYEILAPIGAGGMGEVYRAHDPRLGRDVAIKVLPSHLSASPEVRARFEREARAISKLSHPHICTLHDIGHHDGTDFLVMELLEGETLARRVLKGPLRLTEVLRYGVEIAGALDVAHRAGIVHRDLKPSNIMLTRTGAKLMDFGIARDTGPAAVADGQKTSATMSQPLTAEGTIVGTPHYMAPEQLEGRAADARSDVWALGCVLYEMATGKRAFGGTSQASLIAAVLKESPRPMAELQPLTPLALDRIVARCLEKDPDERWQSARDVAFALEGLRGGSSASAPVEVTGAPRAWKRRIARAIAGLAAAVALVAVGFLAGGRLTERRTAPPTFKRLTFQRGSIVNARFAPDGNSVIYSAAWDGDPLEVFETRTDLSMTRPLGLPAISLHSVSSTGRLALRRNAEPWNVTAAPLAVVDVAGSAPRDLLEDVAFADWSPDGSTLAVVWYEAGSARLEMPPGNVLVTTSGWFGDIRVSRDGRHIALIDHPVVADTRGSVAVVDTTGRKRTLTGEYMGLSGLAWSPNGREIWFSAAADGAQQSLYAVALNGRLRNLARFPTSVTLHDATPDGRVLLESESLWTGIRGRSATADAERELGWLDHPVPRALSADGGMLLFEDQGETAGPSNAIYLRSMDGSQPVRLGEGSGCALSPDGRRVLAIHFGPPHRLILMPTGSGETLTLPHGPVETYQTADFLPDGRRVAFVGAEPGRPQRTWVQELPDGLPKPVTPEGIVGVTTSPDGRWVAAVTRDATLVLAPIDGGEARQAARLDVGEEISQWSADGKTLFVAGRGYRIQVYGIDVESGQRQLWRTCDVPDPAGVALQLFVMTRDGRSYAYSYSRYLDELYLVTGLE